MKSVGLWWGCCDSFNPNTMCVPTIQHHDTHSVVWRSACCYIQLCKSTRILTDTMTSIVQHTERLPPCPARLPGAATCQTSRSCGSSPPWAVGRASLARTEPSWSPDAPSSYAHTHTHSSACLNAHGSQTPLSRASHLWTHLLWIFSSIDLAQNALISKSTPQACRDTMSSWPCSRSS